MTADRKDENKKKGETSGMVMLWRILYYLFNANVTHLLSTGNNTTGKQVE